ncbi:MAG: carbohydrate ABC transporter permease [Deltaproteobacteria bacterium]|nr:MAG: carbohydrate ABC transporter permease [Deltaproteobacteria bacterium]
MNGRFLKTWLPLALFAIFLLFPFYWMVLTALRPNAELVSTTANPFWVRHPTLEHIQYLLRGTSFPRWFWNTMGIATGASILSVAVRFPFAAGAGLAIYLGYLIPPAILFIPLADVLLQLGWFDKPLALVPVYTTFLIPFCTWLLMGFLKTIPREIEEAAMVDGAGRVRIMLGIVLPLSGPGLISAFIFAFTLSWNEYLYALVFMSAPEHKTVPVGLATELVRGDLYQWGPLMAGALLGCIPVVILYFLFVDRYVQGMSGALKG